MTKLTLILGVVFLLSWMIIRSEYGSVPPNTTQEARHVTFSKENGSLVVYTPKNQSCSLVINAIAYEPYVSPDENWIAVEIQLLSNIQIIRIYQKDEKGCYHVLQSSFSTKVWQGLAKKKGFALDDVLHPRMQFIKWIDNAHLQIEILGELKERSIDEKLIYGL